MDKRAKILITTNKIDVREVPKQTEESAKEHIERPLDFVLPHIHANPLGFDFIKRISVVRKKRLQ